MSVRFVRLFFSIFCRYFIIFIIFMFHSFSCFAFKFILCVARAGFFPFNLVFLRSHFMLAWKCVCSSVFQLLSFWCFSVWFLMSAHRLPDCLFSSFLFYLLWYFAIILSFSVRLCVRMYKPICSVLLLLLFSFFASQLFLIRICCLLLPSLFSHRLSIQFYLFMMFSFSFFFFWNFLLKNAFMWYASYRSK